MRLIDGDYLYNKLVANKCPYDLVLQMVKDEPTVCDIEQIRAEIELLSNANPSYWHSGDMVEREEVLEIIDKYRGGTNDRY